ncbi:MAG TPA: type II TA system antitoxin MqsA family protein [Polyangiales bacterium]
MAHCRVCRSSEIEAGTTELHNTVNGTTFAAALPAIVCRACGDATVDADASKAFELRVAAELAAMGRPTPEAFRFMRTALGFRGPQFAQLLGVDRGTLSRWENGVLRVDRGAFVVLGGLVVERLSGRDDTLARLRALHSPETATHKRVELNGMLAQKPQHLTEAQRATSPL